MFSSCPRALLVAGVKIASERRSASTSRGGSLTPQTSRVLRYSAQPEPARYPRATHSKGMTSAFFTRTDRPSRIAPSPTSASGKRVASVSIR